MKFKNASPLHTNKVVHNVHETHLEIFMENTTTTTTTRTRKTTTKNVEYFNRKMGENYLFIEMHLRLGRVLGSHFFVKNCQLKNVKDCYKRTRTYYTSLKRSFMHRNSGHILYDTVLLIVEFQLASSTYVKLLLRFRTKFLGKQ